MCDEVLENFGNLAISFSYHHLVFRTKVKKCKEHMKNRNLKVHMIQLNLEKQFNQSFGYETLLLIINYFYNQINIVDKIGRVVIPQTKEMPRCSPFHRL